MEARTTRIIFASLTSLSSAHRGREGGDECRGAGGQEGDGAEGAGGPAARDRDERVSLSLAFHFNRHFYLRFFGPSSLLTLSLRFSFCWLFVAVLHFFLPFFSYESKLYEKYLSAVRREISQLRVIFESVEAKAKGFFSSLYYVLFRIAVSLRLLSRNF